LNWGVRNFVLGSSPILVEGAANAFAPERIRDALIARAAEIEYPIEAVVEIAIASFLDTEALGFADCKPGRRQ
jgi:hypothetical protein